jgi:hypothetical protein
MFSCLSRKRDRDHLLQPRGYGRIQEASWNQEMGMIIMRTNDVVVVVTNKTWKQLCGPFIRSMALFGFIARDYGGPGELGGEVIAAGESVH